MAYTDGDEEIECEIIESYGIFSAGIRFWNKEVNLVSWNGRPAKLDIRNWQRDHKKCGKGITLTREEAEELVRLLGEILKKSPGASQRPGPSGKTGASKQAGTSKQPGTSGKTGASKKTSPGRAKKAPQVPAGLKPFYDELKLLFGAGPGECKTARNSLLKKYHPDMYSGSISFATKKTIKIKEAYEKIIQWWNENGLA